jgi:hypothetical protein
MGLSEEESDISPDRPGRVIQDQDSPNGADFSQRIVARLGGERAITTTWKDASHLGQMSVTE